MTSTFSTGPSVFGKTSTGRLNHRLPYPLHECPGAAATNGHALGCLNNRNFFVHSSGGQASEMKVWAGPCSLQSLQGRSFLGSSSFWWFQASLGLWPHHPLFMWSSCMEHGLGGGGQGYRGRPYLLCSSIRPGPGSHNSSVNAGGRQGASSVGAWNPRGESVWGKRECVVVTQQKHDGPPPKIWFQCGN